MDNKILTAEQELKLRKPIDDRVGAIQKEIDDLRADGTNKKGPHLYKGREGCQDYQIPGGAGTGQGRGGRQQR